MSLFSRSDSLVVVVVVVSLRVPYGSRLYIAHAADRIHSSHLRSLDQQELKRSIEFVRTRAHAYRHDISVDLMLPPRHLIISSECYAHRSSEQARAGERENIDRGEAGVCVRIMLRIETNNHVDHLIEKVTEIGTHAAHARRSQTQHSWTCRLPMQRTRWTSKRSSDSFLHRTRVE